MSVLTRYASDSIDLVDLQDGKSRVTLQYFYVTGNDASAPASPSGNFTYNFSTGVLTTTGSFGDWTDNPDSLSLSETLWMVSITVEGFNTATFGASDWNGPVVLSRVGFQPTQPDPATSVATVFLYKAGSSSTTAPTGNPSGNFTYTFASGALSGGTLNGWSQTLPTVAPGNYVWVKQATASSTSTTDTIPASEFNASGEIVLAGTGTDGVDGYNTAVVQLYKKNSSSSSAPADPTGTFTYTFSTGVLSGGTFDGWTQSAPSIAKGEYLWIIQASAVSRNNTDTIGAAEFGAAQIVGIGGEDGATPPPLTVTDTDRDGQNQTITFSDGSSITITDGDDGTSEGVAVVYANDAAGDGKSFDQGSREFVLYYEWTGSKPSLSEITGTWVKFIGRDGTDAVNSGVVPVYSSVQNPSNMTPISLTLGTRKFVTFYEWSDSRPTQDSQLPSNLHQQTFVQFVADPPDAPDAPDAPDSPPRYYSIRAYSSTSTSTPTATLTWSNLSVSVATSGWTTTAPTINANTTSTTWYFSDFVFIDTTGTASTSTDTGTARQKVVSFDGIVTFTNTNGDVTISDGSNSELVLADGGTTEIDGGRITANSMSLASVADASDADGSMLLTSDLITIKDASGNPRVLIGKLP